MHVFIYNIGILLYRIAIQIAVPFNKKAASWVKGRQHLIERIKSEIKDSKHTIWIHAASLGEFEQGRPVIEKFRLQHPDSRVILTFFSPSGYEIRKNYNGADHVYYLPLDTSSNAKHFIQAIQPDIAIFVKYEYWYHYLATLHAQHIPTFLISAIFRKEQPFFQPWGKLHRRMLHCFSYIFVQDQESVDLLQQIDITQVQQTGDTRFDRVKQIASTAKRIDKIETFCAGEQAIVCGSTWPGDEEIILDYINKQTTKHKWILVPHEITANHIQSILNKSKRKTARYTDECDDLSTCEILVVDYIGLLSSIYRYGFIAYIGGGFGRGIHNTLEAAIYGIPVIFGPKYHKFKEAVELIARGGGFSIRDADEFTSLMDSLINNPAISRTAGNNAAEFVNQQLGATDTILKKIDCL